MKIQIKSSAQSVTAASTSQLSKVLEKLKEGFDDLHIKFKSLSGGTESNVHYLAYDWDEVETNDVHHILTMACDDNSVRRAKNPLDNTEEVFSGRIDDTYITVDTRMSVFCVVL